MWRKGWHSLYRVAESSWEEFLDLVQIVHGIHSCKRGPRNKQEIRHPQSVPMGVERSFLLARNAGHRAMRIAAR